MKPHRAHLGRHLGEEFHNCVLLLAGLGGCLGQEHGLCLGKLGLEDCQEQVDLQQHDHTMSHLSQE